MNQITVSHAFVNLSALNQLILFVVQRWVYSTLSHKVLYGALESVDVLWHHRNHHHYYYYMPQHFSWLLIKFIIIVVRTTVLIVHMQWINCIVLCVSEKWSPALQIRTVLLSIQALLSAPNPDDPLANDVAEQWKVNEAQAIETGTHSFINLLTLYLWRISWNSFPTFSFYYPRHADYVGQHG